jgi:DNA-directed RNA polymerase specialized sigma24 family protein
MAEGQIGIPTAAMVREAWQLASTDGTTPEQPMVNCSDVASYGSLALDGSLPVQAAVAIGQHISTCQDCANYIDQIAKTRALLAIRGDARPAPEPAAQPEGQATDDAGAPDYSPLVLAQNHAYLVTLARATDPAHADDLVQDTWDHFLSASPLTILDRAELAAYLIQSAHDHVRDEEADAQAWADNLVRHHPHNPADLAETDLPADPGGHEDWRTLADLDVLDPDADGAELYLPDLYDDGPNKGEWSVPPTAWPSVSRMLGPDEEAQTAELYSMVDSALDELPAALGDAVYLVDIEGHSLSTASSLLGRSIPDLQRDLVQARNHVRGRVNDYLASR